MDKLFAAADWIIAEPPHVHVALGSDFYTTMSRFQKLEDAALKLAEKDGISLIYPDKRASLGEVALKAAEANGHMIDLDRLTDSGSAIADAAPAIAKAAIQARYEALLALTCEVPPTGNWLYVLADLARPAGAPDLLIDQVPDLIEQHPSVSIFQVPPETATELATTLRDTCQALRMKYEDQSIRFPTKPLVAVLKWLWNNLDKIAIAAEGIARVVEAERQRQKEEAERRAEQERIDQGIRNARPLSGAEDHVDRFDSNRDFIRGLC